MATELEDFFPKIPFKDPLKKYEDQISNMALSLAASDSDKAQEEMNPAKKIRYRPNFNVIEYWKQLSGSFNECLLRFIDLKDMISLIYTCKYFKGIIDNESTWTMLQVRDFPIESLKYLKSGTKSQFSIKKYYKFFYLSLVSGIPHHTGYFKTYGSPDIAELSMAIVDFLCPKTEIIKGYIGEILGRNQCKTFDVKLSWLRETNEICLWNGNSTPEFRKPETFNEEPKQFHSFSPCFLKRYSMIDENEEIMKVFFLEDRYLVVKILRKNEKKMIMRILDLEEEFHSIAKGLDSAIPFDYIFSVSKESKIEMKADDDDEFAVEFTLRDPEREASMAIHLLEDNKVVFFTENSKKPQMIF